MENKEPQGLDLSKENEKLKQTIESLRKSSNSYIYSALAKAQAEMPIVDKDSVSYARQKFASLANIIKKTKSILAKNGLSVTQVFASREGRNYLVTRLCHTSGQFIESEILLPVPNIAEKNGVLDRLREEGKSITYLRRYAYTCLLGIATEDVD